jgi:hypothetical protein
MTSQRHRLCAHMQTSRAYSLENMYTVSRLYPRIYRMLRSKLWGNMETRKYPVHLPQVI